MPRVKTDMLLNWFLHPPKKNSANPVGRLARRIAPTWWLSPWRRILQAACLLAFLLLFLYVCFPYTAVPKPSAEGDVAPAWPSHYADDILRKEFLPAELFLAMDPLLGLSTAIASRAWVGSLAVAGVVLLLSLFVPRGFCGYVCPLGTVIDLFDWSIGRRSRRLNVSGKGWYVHLKYYLLVAVLAAAALGVLLSGYVSAIPVVTRAAAFLLTPLETGLARSWHQVPSMHAGQAFSLGLFAAVLALGFLAPRFWCRHVCPTGALFSLANCLRLSERKVAHSCVGCGRCTEVCPFDAIKHDFTTRTGDCAFCQTCGGVCRVSAIQFVPRWASIELKPACEPAIGQTPLPRRSFLASAVGVAAGAVGGMAAAGTIAATGGQRHYPTPFLPVRPPGSLPEPTFLAACIRCGECFQACPNDVLQPMAFQQGIVGLWTPHVVADWSGCEPSCNNCCQVCPTGAIRPIPLQEKRVARMALAVVNQETCLPYAGRRECQICVDECAASGYNALEFMTVGCGLCQTRCRAMNVKTDHLLARSAIVIQAGPGNEDRILTGSYLALREAEARQRRADHPGSEDDPSNAGSYLPDFLK
ncbi:MAG: 4Fe-4S binding protein [Thermoguttaceae bacterium]